MDKRIIELGRLGCDVSGAMARMLDDDEFYISCLNELINSPNFEKLGEALKKRDTEAAFDCAHALKGILGGVGLTPMYKKDCEIVEALRAGCCDGLEDKFNSLIKMRDRLAQIIA